MSRAFFILTAFFAFAFSQDIYASFDVAAKNSSDLAMKGFGIIEKINVDVGSRVKKGEILIELENRSETIALQNAKNDLEIAILAQSHARSTFEKFKKVQSVTSKQNFDDAEFEFKRANLNVQKAKIAIKNAEEQLNNKILRAPYDGIISKKMTDVAEGVSGVTQKLLSIFSYPQVKLVLSFDEKFKDKVKIGDEFVYKIDGENEERVGKISLIYPTIDTKNRKIYAEIYVGDLMPGLFGEGYIKAK